MLRRLTLVTAVAILAGSAAAAQQSSCQNAGQQVKLTMMPGPPAGIEMSGIARQVARALAPKQKVELCVSGIVDALLGAQGPSFKVLVESPSDPSKVAEAPAPRCTGKDCLFVIEPSLGQEFRQDGRFRVRIQGQGLTTFNEEALIFGQPSAPAAMAAAPRLNDQDALAAYRMVAGVRARAAGGCAGGAPDGSWYDVAGDSAVLVFDGEGNLLDAPTCRERAVVNLDQNDVLRIYVVHPDTVAYAIVPLTGTFAPTAVAMPSFSRADLGALQGEVPGTRVAPGLSVLRTTLGPYTSSDFSFAIRRLRSPGDSVVVREWKFSRPVNPIYHVGFQVALVGTSLTKPSFNVGAIPGDTGHTIYRDRASWTVQPVLQVSFYVWHFWDRRAALARGRDLMKDPPFGDRFYPTLGVGITEPLKNLYPGFVYEAARGLGFIAGAHLGSVPQLVTPRSFAFGTQYYTGQAADLKTEDRWQAGWYAGVTLDVQVMRRLLGGEDKKPGQ